MYVGSGFSEGDRDGAHFFLPERRIRACPHIAGGKIKGTKLEEAIAKTFMLTRIPSPHFHVLQFRRYNDDVSFNTF